MKDRIEIATRIVAAMMAAPQVPAGCVYRTADPQWCASQALIAADKILAECAKKDADQPVLPPPSPTPLPPWAAEGARYIDSAGSKNRIGPVDVANQRAVVYGWGGATPPRIFGGREISLGWPCDHEWAPLPIEPAAPAHPAWTGAVLAAEEEAKRQAGVPMGSED